MTAQDAFTLADRLARSLGDYKHQFSFVWYSPDLDENQKLEILHQKLIGARNEILRLEAIIFGGVENE